MLDYILNIINYVVSIDSDVLKVFLLSMLPVTECRLSIPYFLFQKYSTIMVYLISIVGNIGIGVFILYLIGPLLSMFSKIPVLDKAIDYIFNRTRKKMNNLKSVNKFIGLLLFVAIPAPFTGVWTGALGAYLIKIEKKKAVLAIIFGVIISATIVTILSLAGIQIWENILIQQLNKLQLEI